MKKYIVTCFLWLIIVVAGLAKTGDSVQLTVDSLRRSAQKIRIDSLQKTTPGIDYVCIGDREGEVIEKNAFITRLNDIKGNVVTISNNSILSQQTIKIISHSIV